MCGHMCSEEAVGRHALSIRQHTSACVGIRPHTRTASGVRYQTHALKEAVGDMLLKWQLTKMLLKNEAVRKQVRDLKN